ncbi:MAG: MmcQ/YjbR family DNA-binding protein [Dehalococcoidia bacterium]|nr:MmcQ/YjbR family DNA-binding protein [Dehalococcoidia bacterium]
MDEIARLERLRSICLGLPETTERLSHGEPWWFVRDKKAFVGFSNRHHGGEFGFWCAAPLGAQDAMITVHPDRYFRPPYVGHRGWVGVRLDLEEVDWDEVEAVVREAFRVVAPAKLAELA